MSETSMAAAVVVDLVRLRRGLRTARVRTALREEAGLSQAELAGALDVTRQAFGNWERGQRTPRGQHLVAYVEILDRLAALQGEGQ